MTALNAQIVGMNSYQELVRTVSPAISICVRGPHAVGKSEGTYQAAEGIFDEVYKDPKVCQAMITAFGGRVRRHDGSYVSEWTYESGLPVLERRLSQLTEGDIVGLPFKGQRGTAFLPVDWLMIAAEFPVVLFLDERNRALENVKQAVFQLTDSKAFYGARLHENTRVIVAENVGDQYQVTQQDPAEISRCATVELKPSQEEWFKWAKNKMHVMTLEFLKANRKLIGDDQNLNDPLKKTPDRRMWFKLDQECQRLNLLDDPDANMLLLGTMAGAFCGPEVSGRFREFVQTYDRQVSVSEILKGWTAARKRLVGPKAKKATKINPEVWASISEQLVSWCEKNTFTDEQAAQLGLCLKEMPAELALKLFTDVASIKNGSIKNISIMHPMVLVHTFRAEDGEGSE
jgi:hypothetical protein